MRIHHLAPLACLALAISCGQSNQTAPVAHQPIPEAVAEPHTTINPFIGTGGHGHTFPGATVPFGMVQLSPDTRLEGWDGCGGYHYSDSLMYGFSHTHLSGTGVSDYGDILLMPFTGTAQFTNGYETGIDNGYGSRFDKSTEVAEAGYYSVQLADYNIKAELTATKRVGMHRYTFPAGAAPKIMVDLAHRDQVISTAWNQVSDTEIEGHRVSKAWAEEQHVYFVMRFSQPITNTEMSSEGLLKLFMPRNVQGQQGLRTLALNFDTLSAPLLVKVGISATDTDGARKNLDAELPGWDFDATRQAAAESWKQAVQRVTVHGGTADQQATFYTALYHSFIAPNLFSDVDGRYRGHDMQLHTDAERETYTVFSLWDTFRATHPLFSLLEPARTNDFIHTFLKNYREGGVLPVWELAGNETYCMIGYHSVPVMADAYAKGIRDWPLNEAIEAAKASAEADRFGLDSYQQYGFVRGGDEAESVSKTLEYAYDDWCIATMLDAAGNTSEASQYRARAASYRNLYNPNTGFFQGRMHGRWFQPFDPSEVNYHFTEANAWQYSTFVPHDISGLMQLLGGPEALEAHLDRLFTASSETTGREQADITGLIGQYAHGNEPSHHMAYLYNYTGSPWKTQQRVRQIMDEMYSNTPAGLSGNEDCGQMSSWYVLSALGLYPVTPGTDVYAIGSPLFPQAVIKLPNGKQFTITAWNNSPDNAYIQSATLNGKPLEAAYLRHADIVAGGHLEFEMGPQPNKAWAAEAAQRPTADLGLPAFASAPYFEAESRTFEHSLTVAIAATNASDGIYYTVDGSTPTTSSTKYSEPITLSETTTINAIAVSGSATSKPVAASFIKVEGGRSILLHSSYANQYAAGGDEALIDYLRGPAEYRTGLWQGYREDMEAVVDLGSERQLTSVGAGFLQDIKSWIWMPREVEFAVSSDGESWQNLATLTHDVPTDKYGAITQDLVAQTSATARYVRLRAKQFGVCPDWHLGAGGNTWIFADEILIETE